MSEEEVTPFLDTPVCLGPNAPISFDCIRVIVSAIRGGSINVMTIRMILLQVDRGLAMMAPTTDIEELELQQFGLLAEMSLDQQLVRIEELFVVPEFPTTAGVKEEILRMLLDYLLKLLIDLLTKVK